MEKMKKLCTVLLDATAIAAHLHTTTVSVASVMSSSHHPYPNPRLIFDVILDIRHDDAGISHVN